MHASSVNDVDIETAYSWDGVALRANMIETLDGSTIGPDGVSRSIGTAMDRAIFLCLRRSAELVLVGAGTFRTEAYRPMTSGPTLCIVSNSLRLTDQLHTLRDCTPRPIVLTSAAADLERRAALTEVATVLTVGERGVELTSAVQQLRDMGFARMLCEGGPQLLADLIAAELVDELCLSIAARRSPATHPLVGPLPRPIEWSTRQVLFDAEGVYLRLTPRRSDLASR